MRISGRGKETYLLLNGLALSRPVKLNAQVDLLPATCRPSTEELSHLFSSEVDLGVAMIFLGRVTSQLRVVADSPEELAHRAWGALWDAVLLAALCRCEVVCNFQSQKPADQLAHPENVLEITNYQLRGLSGGPPQPMPEARALWLEQHFDAATSLLASPAFRGAVHSLATYRWHTVPQAQLALLWAGLEGLFTIQSELSFRISLYVCRFLEPTDTGARRTLFRQVKRLYSERSAAVHGSLPRNVDKAVEASAKLLFRLAEQCVLSGLPDVDQLAP